MHRRLGVQHGALVVQPERGPIPPSALSLTVFKDPRVLVDAAAAQPTIGGFNVPAPAQLTAG